MRFASCTSILLVAVLAAAVARADKEAPTEAARRVLAGFAAPSDANAYAVDFDFYVGGGLLGGGKLAAAPEAVDGKAHWRTTESLTFGPETAPQITVATRALMGGDLRLVEEVRKRTAPEGADGTTAARTEKGFHVTYTKGDKVEEKDHEAHAGTVSGGVATLVLFLRQVPAEAAEYEMSTWSGEARAVQQRTLTLKGIGRMKDEHLGFDREALHAVATGGHGPIEVFVDPKDRSFLAFHPVDQPVWVIRKGIVKAK